jgi:adenosylhomocysteine nucleosidase
MKPAPIGLIAAMPQESEALLRRISGWKRTAPETLRGCAFEWGGQACLLVTSGMGERRAAAAARALIAQHAPRALISFGIGGAVEADLQVGDVVAAEAVCRLEQGAAGALLPLAAWPAAAREAAVRAAAERGARLFCGTAVTTGGCQVAAGRLGQMLHPVLEMETAGIAQAAAEKGIPLFALRAISDGPCAPLPFDLGEMMDADANLQTGRMLKAILRRPAVLFQAGRLVKNSRTAAVNAAAALLAALTFLV